MLLTKSNIWILQDHISITLYTVADTYTILVDGDNVRNMNGTTAKLYVNGEQITRQTLTQEWWIKWSL